MKETTLSDMTDTNYLPTNIRLAENEWQTKTFRFPDRNDLCYIRNNLFRT